MICTTDLIRKTQEIFNKQPKGQSITEIVTNIAQTIRSEFNLDSGEQTEQDRTSAFNLISKTLLIASSGKIKLSGPEIEKMSKSDYTPEVSNVPGDKRKPMIKIDTLINRWFGDSVLSLQLKQDFNFEVLKSFFIDLDNQIESSDNKSGTLRLLQYKSRLFKDLVNYYNSKNSDKINISRDLYSPDGEFIDVDQAIKDKLQNMFAYPLDAVSLDSYILSHPDYVDIYKKWFIYHNFDQLLLSEFNGIINIAKRLVGKDLTNKNKYQLIDTTDQNANNWNDKEKTPDQVMNLILAKLLTTFKMYDHKTGQWKSGVYLSKTDLNTSMSFIKNIVFSREAQHIRLNELMDNVLFNKYNAELTDLKLRSNESSLYDLGNLLRVHGTIAYPILFEILSTSRAQNILTQRLNLKYASWDQIYSLNKNLFEYGGKSLFNLASKNRGKKSDRYYEMFVTQMDLTSPNNATSIELKKDGFREELMFTRGLKYETEAMYKAINAALIQPMYDLGVQIKQLDDGTYEISKEDIFKAIYNPKATHNQSVKIISRISDANQLYSELTRFYGNILQGLSWNNTRFKDAIFAEYAGAGVNEVLLGICIPMAVKHVDMLNYKFESATDLKQYLNQKYHVQEVPKISFPYTQHIDFINNFDLNVFDRLVEIDYTLKNKILKNTYMTADGNMIQAQNITNGSTEVTSRWALSRTNPASVTKDYSVFDRFIRAEKLRELSSREVYKKGTRMSFSENMFTRFVFHFLQPRANNETKVIYSTTSDKEDVGVRVFKFDFADASNGYVTTDKSSLVKELQSSYRATLNLVDTDYRKLNQWLQEERQKGSDTFLYFLNKYNIAPEALYINGYFTDPFRGLNTANNPLSLFLDIVSRYNESKSVIDQLDIVNNVHYSTYKNKLYKNDLIERLYSRYSPENYQEFIKVANLRFLNNLIRNGFELQVKNIEYDKYLYDFFKLLAKSVRYNDKGDRIEDDWIGRDGKLILYKYKSGNKWYNGDASKWELASSNSSEIMLHPALAEFNELHYLLSQQYNNATLGSYIYCAAKGAVKDGITEVLESTKMIDYIKRNVDQSATVNQHLLNSLNGISSELNIAYYPDATAPVQTVAGLKDKVKPHDGSIREEAITHILIQNLSNRPDNTSDKPLITGFLEESGSGWIIKCASYANTNALMRGSESKQLDEKRMLQRKFGIVDVTKDLFGNTINYGDIYVKRGNSFFKVEFTSSGRNDNKYSVTYIPVFRNGEVDPKYSKEVEEGRLTKELEINTNWDLYQVFGGINSCSKNSEGDLELSEESLHKMAKAVCEVQRPKEGLTLDDIKDIKYRTQLHVNQPLKKALINYIVPEGACKKGFTNSNIAEAYELEGFTNFTTQKCIQFGRQLDPTHEVDQAEVSLMTQVMAGLSSSYSYEETTQVYEALAELSNLTNSEFLKTMRSSDPTKFNNMISNLILTNVIKDNKETALKKLLNPLIDQYQTNRKPITYEQFKQYASLDDASTFNYLVSLISSTLSQSSIKQKFTGTLSVLNPSYGIIKTYTGYTDKEKTKLVRDRKLSDFDDPSQLIVPSKQTNFIEFEKTYKAVKTQMINGNEVIDQESDFITVKGIDEYNYLRNLQAQGYKIYEHFYQELPETSNYYTNIFKLTSPDGKTVKYTFKNSRLDDLAINSYINKGYTVNKIRVFGSDLKSYNILFRDIPTDSFATQYQIWDLKIVQDAFKNQNNKLLRKQMQQLLANLSDGKLEEVYVHDFTASERSKYQISDLNQTEDPNMYYLLLTNEQGTFRVDLQKFDEGVYGIDTLNKDLIIEVGNKLAQAEIELVNSKDESDFNDSERQLWLELENEGYVTRDKDEPDVYIFQANTPKYKKIKIDKSSLKIENYQAILPSVHASQLNLPKEVSVSEVLNDELFFLKRNLKPLIADVGRKHYSYALKRLNGKHIYITSDKLSAADGYKTVSFDIEREQKNGKETIYRVDEYGNIVQELSSDKDLIYEYGGDEIVVTDNPEWYIASENYDVLLEGERTKNVEQELIQDKLITYEQWKDDIVNAEEAITLGNSTQSNSHAVQKLIKASREQYTSFKKTLETLVARIPAQGMSSFMTMDIVDFSEGYNNAYVNHMQIFLQGSDYDIDKATFLEYTLDRSGKFVGWSPFFKLSNDTSLKQSLKFVLPNNKKTFSLQKDNNSNNTEVNNVLDKLNKYTSLSFEKRKKSYIIEDTEENLELLQQLLSENFVEISKQINYNVNTLDKKYVSKDKLKQIYNDLIGIYNQHHSYFQNISQDRTEDAIKNFIVFHSCNISKSPKNLLRSSTPIDEASAYLKIVADNTDIARQFKINPNLPGDESAKSLDLINVMTGKEGVGVAASIGVKTYNALLYYYNNKIRELQSTDAWKDVNNWKDIIFDFSFAGKRYGLLASVDIDLDKVPEELKELVYRSQTSTQLTGINTIDIYELTRDIILDTFQNLASFTPKDAKEVTNQFLAYKGRDIEQAVLRELPNLDLNNLNSLAEIFLDFTTGKDSPVREAVLNNILNILSKPEINNKLRLLQTILQASDNVDTRDTVSAWVSLAVDNAKELKLGELNANPDFMGMYLFAGYLGISQNVVSKILTSDTAKILLKYMTDNVYSRTLGLRDPERIIRDKIRKVPEFKDFKIRTRLSEEQIEALFQESQENAAQQSMEQFVEEPAPKDTVLYQIKDAITQYINSGNILSYLNVVDSKRGYWVLDTSKVQNVLHLEKFRDEVRSLRKFIDAKNLDIDYHTKNAIYAYENALTYNLKERNTLNSEKILVGKKVVTKDVQTDGENPEVKTQSKEVDNYELYSDLIIKLYKGQQELAKLRNWLGLNQGLKNKPVDILNFISGIKTSMTSKGESLINIDQYLSDRNYRNLIADQYEDHSGKVVFNIFKIINSLPHYQSYFDSLFIQYNALKMSSIFKLIAEQGYSDLKKVVGGKIEDKTLNIFQSRLLSSRINGWLTNENIIMKVPFVQEIAGKSNHFLKTIKLGNEYDNYLFIKFMNETVIPDLRLGLGVGTTRSFENNLFVQNLVPTTLTNTPNKSLQTAYRLGIEIIPKNDVEQVQLAKTIEAYRQLAVHKYTIEGKSYNIGDLFWIYNLLLHNNRSSVASFTPMFTKLISETPFIKRYYAYLGETETSKEAYTDDMLKVFAPISTVQEADALELKTFWQIDYEKHNYNLFKRLTNREMENAYEIMKQAGMQGEPDRFVQINRHGNFSDEFAYTLDFNKISYQAYLANLNIREKTDEAGTVTSYIIKYKGTDIEIPTAIRLNTKTNKVTHFVDIDLIKAQAEGQQRSC